ncbi:hypothetical protein ABZP36_011932 [Zizania latifolia]
MWPEKMRAWTSMADDPLKHASAAASHPSSPLRRYNPYTLAAAAGGLLLVGAASYFMFKGKQGQGRQGNQPVPRP